MNLITYFLFGFFVAFTGSITPSMLNMTVLKISRQKNRRASINYSLGVSIVVVLQAYIAVYLYHKSLEYLNPSILESIEKLGVGIFIILSFYFYNASKKENLPIKKEESKTENTFFYGVVLSTLNMFSVPFFYGTIALLDILNLFSFNTLPVLSFTLGASIGTFLILLVYVKYAEKIQRYTGSLTKDINFVLSVLTAFFAVISIVKITYKIII
tara:strand:- start:274 stop:912 length:639 start_codon:yes stop_codon:yes gene_type:complete